MKKYTLAKSLIALMLTVCIVTGVLPLQFIKESIAYAESFRVADPGDFTWTFAAAQNNGQPVQTDGEWQYILLTEQNYAVVVGHSDATATSLTLPATLGGADVVAMASGALQAHTALQSLLLPGNLYAIQSGALPQGVTLQGYNGSYAQTYAARNGYAFSRVADFDFRTGVVDYYDISTANFERQSATTVRMRALEARRLAEGKRFFLLDPANLYAISYYTVASISPVAEDGFVTISCTTPNINDVLLSYSGVDEVMVMDPSTIELYDGVTMQQQTGKNFSTGETKDFSFKISQKLSAYAKLDISVGLSQSFKSTYSGGLFQPVKLSMTQTTTSKISAKLSASYTTGSTTSVPKSSGSKVMVDKTLSELRQELAENTKKTGKTLKPQQFKFTMGRGIVFSVAGIVNAQVQFGVRVSFTGEAEASISSTVETTYTYTDGKINTTSHESSKDASISLKGEVKAGIFVSLGIYIGNICVFEGELFAGLQITAKIDIITGGDFITSVNMLDCFTFETKLIVTLTLKVGLWGGSRGVGKNSTFTLLEQPLDFLTFHWHIDPFHYSYDPEKPDAVFFEEKTDRLHFANSCPYDAKTVVLYLPFLPEDQNVYQKIQNLYLNDTVADPGSPNLEIFDRKFLRWVDESGKELAWPLVVTDNAAIYAETVPYYTINLVRSNGKQLIAPHRVTAGTPLMYELMAQEGIATEPIVSWVRVVSPDDLTMIEEVDSTDFHYLMPDEDITLMALCENDVALTFHTGKGEDASTYFSTRYKPFSAPDLSLSRPRYDFGGWMDEDGNAVSFPLTLGKDTPASLHFYPIWNYNGEVTAADLTDATLGTVPGDISAPLQNDQSLFYFSTNSTNNTATITGFNTNAETPVNISVPAQVTKDGVTYTVTALADKAFDQLTQLQAVDLPHTLTSIGQYAFQGCTALKIIDLSNTTVTELMPYFAQGCSSLQCVLLPEGITNISAYAFGGCSALTSVRLNADIQPYAFSGCTSLSHVELGGGVTTIGSYAFKDCTSLTKLEIPDSAKSIGGNFLSGCINLTDLTFHGAPYTLTKAMMTIGKGSQLTNLVLEDGVGWLEDEVFSNGGNSFACLTSIALPDTIQYMGKNVLTGSAIKELDLHMPVIPWGSYLFANNEQLEKVTIRSGKIPDYAFQNCTSLTTVVLEDGVTKIGSGAFSGCAALTALDIPSSVTSYGSKMIEGCTSLTNLTIGGGVSKLTWAANSFYIGMNSALENVVIKAGVTEIEKFVFANTSKADAYYPYKHLKLTSLTLPSTLHTIGEYAFFGMTGLKNLTLGGEVDHMCIERTITGTAFKGCANLENIRIEGSIGDSAFSGLTYLKTVTIGGNNAKIGSSAFANCENLETVILEEGVVSIGNKAFSGCKKLDELIIPDSVTSYGSEMFLGCIGLKTLSIGGGDPTLTHTRSSQYSYYDPFYMGTNNLETLIIREGVTSIGPGVFNNATDSLTTGTGFPNLKELVLPSTLKEIGSYAFYKAGMSSVKLSSSDVSIGSYAFYSCDKLTSITINSDVSSYAFYGNKNLETVILGEGCTSIGSYAFSGCAKLSTIVIPEGVTSVGECAFQNCKALTSLVFPDSMIYYGNECLLGCSNLETLSIGGNNIELTHTHASSSNYYAPFHIGTSNLKHLIIRDGITSIANGVFNNDKYESTNSSFSKLETLELPNTLTSLGYYNFPRTNITSLTLPESLVSLSWSAFEGSDQLKTLVIKGDGLSIGSNAFADCILLENVTFEGDVKSIGEKAFSNCAKITTLSFPDSVTYYGNEMIRGCSGLEDLTIGGGDPTLTHTRSSSSYYYAPFYIGTTNNLKRLTIREGVTSIGEAVFNNATDALYSGTGFVHLERVELPASLTEIGRYAFYNAGTSELIIHSDKVSISTNAFYGNTNLKHLTLSGTIESYAFENCTSLETLMVRGNATIGSSAFSGCEKLTKVDLGEGLTSVGSNAFKNCKLLTSLAFPDSVTSYGSCIIQGCVNLEELTVGGGKKELYARNSYDTWKAEYSPFYVGTSSKVKRLTINDGVTLIDYEVFNYTLLEELRLPNTLQEIYCRFNNTQLKSLVIPSSTTKIADSVFANNTQLTRVVIGGTNLAVGYGAFRGCTLLKDLTLLEGVASLGSAAFENCTSLKSLVLPSTITNLGNKFILGCTNLETLDIYANIATLNNSLITGSSYYTPFYIGDGAKLQRLVVGGGVQVLDNYVLANSATDYASNCYGFNSLTSVILDDSVTQIGYGHLNKWPNLRHLYLGDNVTSISNTWGNSTYPDLTFYTDHFNQVVADFAAQVGSSYVVREDGSWPTFQVSYVTNATLSVGTRAVSDGTLLAQSGLQGKSVTLPEGYTLLDEVSVGYGDSITLPEAPALAGYTFGGWYVDIDCTTPWTDALMPSCDVTLYARMLPVSEVRFALNDPSAGEPDAALPEGFALHSTVTATQLDEIALPEISLPGRVFEGWFKDATFTQPWSAAFDRMPGESLTLYGKFTPQHSVSYVVIVGDEQQAHSTVTVNQGDWAPVPEDPTLAGYVFAGWYQEPELIHPWSGMAIYTSDVTVYGKMVRLSAGARYELSGDGYRLASYTLEQDESTQVYLPGKYNGLPITSIAANAFRSDEITWLRLPEHLNTLGTEDSQSFPEFEGLTQVRGYEISANNPYFTTSGGVLYSKDMTILYRYPQGRKVSTFTLPASVVEIAPRAFYGASALKQVTFNDGLKTIGDEAFSGTSLTSVTLPDTTTSIGKEAFAGNEDMKSFTAQGLTSIGQNALPEAMNLTVRGPIGSGALRDYCMVTQSDGSEVMFLPYNLYTVTLYVDGSKKASIGCEAGLPLPDIITGAELANGKVTGDWFTDSARTLPWDMAADLMPSSMLTLYTVSTSLFSYEQQTFVVGTETAEDGTVTDVTVTGLVLTSYNGMGGDVILPEAIDGVAVVALGESFLAASRASVDSLTIHKDVIHIADTALAAPESAPFGGVVHADAGTYAAQWAQDHGYDCLLRQYQLSFVTGALPVSPLTAAASTVITLPTPTRTDASFLGWYTDQALTTPAQLDDMGKYVMPAGSTVLYAAWDTQDVQTDFLYEITQEGVTITGYTGSETSVTVPASIGGLPVTAIGEGAFRGNTAISRIILPDSLTSVGKEAFAGAQLITVDFGGAAIIGENAFEGCTRLTTLMMDQVTAIGEGAFSGCTLLRTLPLPETLQSIGKNAFSSCIALTEVTLPDSLYRVDALAFSQCIALRSVAFGAGAGSISSDAFNGCTRLTTFTVSEDNTELTVIDGMLFDMGSLRLVRYPQAMEGTACTLPEGVMAIAPSAFEGASKLETITLPDSLTSIGANALRQCTALTSFTLPENAAVQSIPSGAFSGCRALTQVTLNAHVTAIESNAFSGCTALEQVAVCPETTDISALAFGHSEVLCFVGVTGSAVHTYALDNGYFFTDPSLPQVETLTLSHEEVTLWRGEQLQLSASILPLAAAEATLTWHSANESVALVHDGLISAMGGGSTVITVSAPNGVQAQCTVTVNVAAQQVTLQSVDHRLARGESYQLQAEVLPLTTTDKTLTWVSSDETILTVDETGLVTPLQQGTATVTATTHNGLTAQLPLEVYHPVESIELTIPEQELYAVIGLNTMTLTAAVLPEDASDKTLLWQSSDTAVLTVVDGVITAHKSGTATVTATAADERGTTAECTITVAQRDLSGIDLPTPEPAVYTGSAHTPVLNLVMDDVALVENVDYTITLSESVNVGEHTLTVTGMGNYTGTASTVFTIVAAEPTLLYTGSDAYLATNPAPTWSITPAAEVTLSYALVNADGTHTPIDGAPDQPGQYLLTIATLPNNNILPASITVPLVLASSWAESLTPSASSFTLVPGQVVMADCTVTPADCHHGLLTWTSSDSAVVSVDESGVLTAQASGSAVITATEPYGGAQMTLQVTVASLDNLLTLSSLLTSVEEEAFMGMASIQRIIASDKLTDIGERAFAGMTQLQQIVLPTSVSQIAPTAFADSPNVTLLIYNGTPAHAFAMEHSLPYLFLQQ